MGCFMILHSCGCCRCAHMCEYATTIDTNPLNLPTRADVVPKSWQCWWEGPLWFSHAASNWNQVGPSGFVPRYSHRIELLKATQVNLYDHNHTYAVGLAPNAAPLLTTVQPDKWSRVCCHVLSGQGFSSRKRNLFFSQGKPVWVEWVLRTNTATQRNIGVCRGTRTSVHIMRSYSAPHTSSSSTQWRTGGFPDELWIIHHWLSSPGLVHLWATHTLQA